MKKIILMFVLFNTILLTLACDEVTQTTVPLEVTSTSSMDITTASLTTTENPCKACDATYDYNSLDYQLVWFDEFDKESGVPSINKWNYETGDGGWGNEELQYYTSGANASIISGNLVISARKESMGDSLYTSSRMNSSRSFLYGKFEVKAKLPQGSGTWPAIWLMPERSIYGNWPYSGEIDMMEHVGWDMGKVHFSVHTQRYYHKINTQKTSITTIQNMATEFHIYSIEWLPDQIMFFVDGILKWIYRPTDYVACPTQAEWPFDKPFFLILNIAIGGWGGSPYASFEEEQMLVDYVRIYQASNLFA